MKRMSLFSGLFILILVLAFGCSVFSNQEPDYEEIANKITAKTAQKLRKEKELIPAGFGGGMMDDIKNMMLAFDYHKELDVREARKLLVYAVEEYLSAINSNREVRPYLHNYPFTAKNIELVIYFYNKDRTEPTHDKISVAIANEGAVRYYNRPQIGHRLVTLHEETYEEALDIIAKEDKNLEPPKTPIDTQKQAAALKETDAAISPADTCMQGGEKERYGRPEYFGPRMERDTALELDRYGMAVAKKHGMKFQRVGNFSDNNQVIYSLMFINFHQMTLEQGKEFARARVLDFFRELRTNPMVKRYHHYTNKYYKKMRFPLLMTEQPAPEHMGLKIAFWDKNFDRPKKPYLAEIAFVSGNFYYYEANPNTQARELVLQEKFADFVDPSGQSQSSKCGEKETCP